MRPLRLLCRLTCCPALTGVRMTLSPTTTLSPLDLSCKNKICQRQPASQARNQVWGYIKHQTHLLLLNHHHHQLRTIFNLQIPSNLNIIHPTSWPFFTRFQVHPEKNWDLKTATSDENYNLEDAGWKMFGMDELILIFCSRPPDIKHLTHFRFCFKNTTRQWDD